MKISLSDPSHHQRSWLLLLVVIALLAITTRLLTYDRYLPFVDYSDEVVYVALADEQRGYSDQTALREQYGSLAPLYVSANVIVQNIHDALKPHPWHIPGEYLYSMRLLSVLCGVGTALIMAWIGWMLAGSFTAVLSGLIWALSPIIVNFNSLAIPDPMLYCVCALAVAAAIAAWQRRSLRWLIVSLMAGIVAIYLKLWIVTAILPFVMVSSALLLRDRTLLLRIALLYGIALLFMLHFLVVINPLANTNKVSDYASSGGFLASLFDVGRLTNNFWHINYPIDGGLGLSLVILGVGVGAYIYARSTGRQVPDPKALGVVGVYVIATWWLSAGISRVNLSTEGRMRHIFPVVIAFIPLWSACLNQIKLISRQLPTRSRNLTRWGVYGLAAALVIGFVPGDISLIEQYSHTATFTHLSNWFDSSPPRDGIVLMSESSRYNTVWNRYWGAYMGSKPYEWWLTPTDDIALSTPDDYRDRNIRWLVLTEVDIARAQAQERLRAYLDNLLLVKTVQPQPGEIDGVPFYVYRFEQPQEQANYTFGGQITLTGYDLSSSVIKGGDTISLRLYWGLEQATPLNLSMFVHIYSRESLTTGTPSILTQWDGELLPRGNRPTSTWTDLSEVYFGDPLQLTIPSDTPTGDYVLAVGLYDYLTVQQLSGADGQTFFSVPLNITD